MADIISILSKYNIPKQDNVSEDAILKIQNKVGFTLPEDYVYYLHNFQGFESFIGDEYVSLWDLNELLIQNEEYLIIENLPKTIGIGSNGASELIAIEMIDDTNYKVVLTPFIDLSNEYHIPIGDSFTDFLKRLDDGQQWFEGFE